MIAIRKFIVTGMGSGYLRPAPGSWGSLFACGVYFALMLAAGRLADGEYLATAAYVIPGVIALLSTVGCVLLGRFAERAFARSDPQQVTLDEWAGQSVALIGLPCVSSMGRSAVCIGIAFVAFRFFDIVKPPPIRKLEELPHGWGIVADDLAAGVYACIVTQQVLRFIVYPL